MKNKLVLNINEFEVQISGLDDEMKLKLENDFYYFQNLKKPIQKTLTIDIVESKIEIPSNIVASGQSQNSITYDRDHIRYNDYYGEALTMFDYKIEMCQINCEDQFLLHELIYIIILSRSGKFMDSIGLHKIHACGVSLKNKNLLLMMDSKGGKSSTFLELLRDKDIKVISDDTPIVERSGQVRAFPLRVGVESSDELRAKFPYINESNFYEFKRKKYSEKKLVSLSCFNNKIGVKSEHILIQGFRSTYDEPKIIKIGKLHMLKYLTRHMIVGIGLPLIIEYFLEHTLLDHVRNFKILFSRIVSAINLLIKSDTYVMYCSSNIVKNGQVLKERFYEK